jgi:hypothetical protein
MLISKWWQKRKYETFWEEMVWHKCELGIHMAHGCRPTVYYIYSKERNLEEVATTRV